MPAAMLFLASSTLGALSTAKKPGSSPTLYKTWVSTPSAGQISRWRDLVSASVLLLP